MSNESYHHFCPIAKACEILEPRWTLLVLCELLNGATRFNDIRRGVPSMSPTLLSKRLKEMEGLAQSYKGVEKAFAIQAGRELRVIVESEKLDDKQTEQLSFDIANKIQTEMTYPGQVKVTVIRETRAVNYAK